MILSGISKPPQEQQAIFVKWIYVDVADFQKDDDDENMKLMDDKEKFGEKLSKLDFEDIDQYCKV
jgi:hypothetical protein